MFGLLYLGSKFQGSGYFGIFRFIPIPNGKFTHFLIFYALVQFKVLRRSDIQFQSTNLSSDGLRFDFS